MQCLIQYNRQEYIKCMRCDSRKLSDIVVFQVYACSIISLSNYLSKRDLTAKCKLKLRFEN